jgi:hypothetical protein
MIVATGTWRFKVTGDAADAEATNASRTNKSRSSRGHKILSTRAGRRFEFDKRSQLFIRTHNKTLSFTAMRVCNPDRLPVGIHG